MNKNIPALLILLLLLNATVKSQVINDIFDEIPGLNIYYNGLGSQNWVNATSVGINNHAGSQAFLSANGSAATFVDLGLFKQLGGVIQDSVYTVSFYITKYTALGMTSSDFSELRIGGSSGSCQWIQTFNPVQGVWEQWVGIYTPDSADLGDPFDFVAVFDLAGNNHSIAIDGPITVTSDPSSVNHIDDKLFLLHPNPASDVLQITFSGNIGAVRVHNIYGNKVAEQL